MENLRQEVATLRAEVQALHRENLELRQQVGYWRSRHRDALGRITALEQTVAQLEGEKRQLQADLFGRRSEAHSRYDRSHDLEDPQDDSLRPQRQRGQQPENPGPQRRDYSPLPVREEVLELPPEHCVCPRCGQPLRRLSDTEDSEQIEIEMRAYRRRIRRRRYQRTCTCDGTNTLTAPSPPKLIPKARYGLSVWVEILLDKYFSYRPTERLLASWRLLGLDLAPGTVTDGLQRLEVLLRPIYAALVERNPHGDLHQGDETRWRVFIALEGKEGYGWWLWVVLGPDTVIYLLEASRSHTVPENHYRAESRGVLVVDRYAAYKAMSWVQDGVVVLAFCWSHVRRDFIRVGKGWPTLKTWALEWLRRIRVLYRLNDSRLAVQKDTAAFGEADGRLRQAVAAMKTQSETELARADLATPCRKVLESLQEHWEGLTRFVDDPRIPMDNNASERQARGPAVARKNFYGSGSEWSGCLAAAMFSIFATLSRWMLNPRKWLTWYFEHCAAAGGQVPKDIPRFLPWNLDAATQKELGAVGLPEGDDTS
ncbi:MAG TPA: IS66 family transposase [Isosphaeraceae bacterium]|nr:IS66 family transposase [Isosphaeraceae bacterium]